MVNMSHHQGNQHDRTPGQESQEGDKENLWYVQEVFDGSYIQMMALVKLVIFCIALKVS
jgi:hypothetical protein